jgi:iron(II)-dependent oxidoreductase
VPGRDWRFDAEEATLRPLAPVAVDAFWMDRFAVTNRQFWEFVRDGGYRDARWWHPEIREARQEFTDQSGLPGPRFWHQGRYPHELAEHPVVGVCWYEAAAYAQWAGKRLPTDPEWLQAVSNLASRNQQWSVTPFPWGDLFDPQLANLWETDLGRTAPVDAFPGGDSPEGVRQLVGNVWEWTSSGYGEYDVGTDFVTPALWKSLRGGAFDTYFANQAGRFFQSGDSPLARRRNVGFRCVVSASCVALAPEETP